MNKTSFILKYLQIIAFILLSTFGVVFIYYSWKEVDKRQAEYAFQLARSCESLLSKNAISKLSGHINDTSKPEYHLLKNKLESIVITDNKIRFAYLWVERNGRIFFLADSEPEGSINISLPGHEYSEAKPEDIKPFKEGKEYITHELTDRWGTWKSIYEPIKDRKTGKILAVLGLDYEASVWKQRVLNELIESILLILLIQILFYVVIKFFLKNKSLKEILSEHRKAENALIVSEKKFRNLVETTSDIIWETNMEGFYTYLSPQVEKVLGYNSSELIGKTPMALMPTNEAKRVKKKSDEIIASKKSYYGLVNIVLHKNGKEIVLETSGVPILDEEGKLTGYRGIERDITERKINEDLIINTNKKLKIILDVAGEGIIGVNKEGNIIFANPKAAEFLGYKIDELVGKHSHTLFHHSYPDGSHFPAEKCPNYTTLMFGENIIGEDYFWKNDHTGFHVSFSSAPIYENNKISGLVITFIDITKRKESENEILNKNRELERFNKLMVNREQKMIELKKEINELLLKSGREEKYKNRMD